MVGEQRWFAQCGFEALATCWLFPGRTVRLDAACLDCADPMVLDIRDGRLETESRRHLLDGDYLERWAGRRWPERRDSLQRIGKANTYWMPASP